MDGKGLSVIIGSDHAGYEMKEQLITTFGQRSYRFTDKGAFSGESVDYPDFAREVCEHYLFGGFDYGVLICGSGNGMVMSANRYKGIRAALCWSEEIARLARLHNNANILVLPGRFLTKDEAERIFKVFMITNFEGGRHIRRVEKMDLLNH